MPEATMTRSQLKRQAIVSAAKKAFKEFGVQATSMDKLAELAQVSKRTVYNHFDTKEALVMHLVTELWQSAMLDNHLAYDAKKSLTEQLKQLVSHEINLLSSQEYIDLSRVAFGHLFYNPKALMEEMAKFNEQETGIEKWLHAACLDNRLSINDTSFANNQLHHLIKGGCFWPLLLQIAPPLDNQQKNELCEETVTMFLARYKV